MSVMQDLHDSEINASISSFFDGIWIARLGDEMNGWRATATLGSFNEAEQWLDQKARELFPESVYALGPDEFLRRLPAGERVEKPVHH